MQIVGSLKWNIGISDELINLHIFSSHSNNNRTDLLAVDGKNKYLTLVLIEMGSKHDNRRGEHEWREHGAVPCMVSIQTCVTTKFFQRLSPSTRAFLTNLNSH